MGNLETRITGTRRVKTLLASIGIGLLVVLAGCSELEEVDEPSQAGVPPVATSTVAADASNPTVEEPTAVLAQPTTAPIQTPTPAAPRPEIEYTVQAGDTLSAIALQFDTTVEALMAANNLESSALIYVGQKLKVPGPAPAAAGVVPTAAAASNPTAPPAEATAPPAPTTAPPAPEPPAAQREPVIVNGRAYDAYNEAAIKRGQWYQYTCEFDAAWIVLKTYGFDVSLEEQVEIVGLDTSIEPYYKDTPDGLIIYGGDVRNAYSGDYKKNFLARSSGQAMRKLFEHYGLGVTAVQDRASLEEALLRGELVWIKTTVDFKPWREATWVMPDGSSYQTVLGNDHALVVMGFNETGVVIRDPLGPTSTGPNRPYEYMVPWEQFMAAWGAQQYDGLAVAPPGL